MLRKLYISLAVLLAVACSAHAQGELRLAVEDINMEAGKTATLKVEYQFDQEDTYEGYEFHLYLPEGLKVATNSRGRIIYTPGKCHDGHVVAANYKTKGLADGEEPHYVFLCYSPDNYPLLGTEGTLMTIPVEVDASVTDTDLFAYLTAVVIHDQHVNDVDFFFINQQSDIPDDAPANFIMPTQGMMTYAYPRALDFSEVQGLKAYIASGFNPMTGEMLMTRVQQAPAGEGLLLKGDPNMFYEVPTTTTDMYYSNLLHGVTRATNIAPTSDGNTNFILEDEEFYAMKFKQFFDANTAYLSLPLSIADMTSEVKMIFDDDDDIPTDITNLARTNSGQTEWYTPDGRQVTAPRHGLYIVNGKKVVVK